MNIGRRGDVPMKLLSIAVPSYNSQEYLHHAIESLLPGGEQVEILIIDDGSKDNTGKIADEYQRQYPGIVYVIHQENGGHGDAVMAALQNATGSYFKVVDSDDWVDAEAYHKVLETLSNMAALDQQIDLMICNYVYDKVGVKHKRVIRYGNALPENQVISWRDVRRFRVGQYILMHAAIYRTQLLRDCGLALPKHTFYVDSLYVYVPLTKVEKLYYLNVDFYHYFIGRDDQSVQEQVMIRRIDQQILVNRLMAEAVNLSLITDRHKRNYMRNYLEIISTVSSVLLVKAGTDESMQKKKRLWADLKLNAPENYRMIRWRTLGVINHLPGVLGQRIMLIGYRLSQKIFGFN